MLRAGFIINGDAKLTDGKKVRLYGHGFIISGVPNGVLSLDREGIKGVFSGTRIPQLTFPMYGQCHAEAVGTWDGKNSTATIDMADGADTVKFRVTCAGVVVLESDMQFLNDPATPADDRDYVTVFSP